MQAIWEGKNEEGVSGEANSIDAVVRVGSGSRYIEEKCVGGTGDREIRIWNNRGIFNRDKEGVWGRRRGVSEGSRVNKARVGRENNRGICSGIQESSKRKWVWEKATGRRI